MPVNYIHSDPPDIIYMRNRDMKYHYPSSDKFKKEDKSCTKIVCKIILLITLPPIKAQDFYEAWKYKGHYISKK